MREDNYWEKITLSKKGLKKNWSDNWKGYSIKEFALIIKELVVDKYELLLFGKKECLQEEERRIDPFKAEAQISWQIATSDQKRTYSRILSWLNFICSTISLSYLARWKRKALFLHFSFGSKWWYLFLIL